MSEAGYVLQSLVDMRSEMREFHASLRLDMQGLRTEVRQQNGRIGETETAITIIETERKVEAAQAVKRGTWAGVLAAAGLTGMIEVGKALFHK